MKGNVVEETKRKIVYDGQYFVVVLRPKQLLKFSKMLGKKGVTVANSAIMAFVQKKMKKVIDTIVTADDWGKDNATIYNKVVDDVNNYKPGKEE